MKSAGTSLRPLPQNNSVDEVQAAIYSAVCTALISVSATFLVMRRGEVSKQLNDLVQEIVEWKRRGENYWTKDAGSADQFVAEIRIRGQSSKIGKEISRLENRYRSFRFRDKHTLTLVRQAITLSPFGQATATQDIARVEPVIEAADNLIAAIKNSHRLFCA